MPDSALKLDIDHSFSRSGFHLRASVKLQPGWNVLFGPSGAGKSSVLRAVAGLLRPQSGTIRLGQHIWLDSERGTFLPPEKRRAGYLAQAPTLFPHLNVEQNLAFARRFQTGGRDILPFLERFHCKHLRHRTPAELSGGEQQRVALARTLAAGPQILLLDEPLRALDTVLREQIFADLKAYLSADPIPVIAVSHDVVEILSMGAHVLRMDNGSIVSQGPAIDLLRAERTHILNQLTTTTESLA